MNVPPSPVNVGWIDFEGWCRVIYPPEGVLPDDCWLTSMYRRFGVPSDKLRMNWEKAFVAMSPGSDVLRRLACELAAIEASGGNVELAYFNTEVWGARVDRR